MTNIPTLWLTPFLPSVRRAYIPSGILLTSAVAVGVLPSKRNGMVAVTEPCNVVAMRYLASVSRRDAGSVTRLPSQWSSGSEAS